MEIFLGYFIWGLFGAIAYFLDLYAHDNISKINYYVLFICLLLGPLLFIAQGYLYFREK